MTPRPLFHPSVVEQFSAPPIMACTVRVEMVGKTISVHERDGGAKITKWETNRARRKNSFSIQHFPPFSLTRQCSMEHTLAVHLLFSVHLQLRMISRSDLKRSLCRHTFLSPHPLGPILINGVVLGRLECGGYKQDLMQFQPPEQIFRDEEPVVSSAVFSYPLPSPHMHDEKGNR